jgi:hypothetical protein
MHVISLYTYNKNAVKSIVYYYYIFHHFLLL